MLAACGLVVLTLAVLGSALRGPLETIRRTGSVVPGLEGISPPAPGPTPTDEQTDELGIDGVQPVAPELEAPSWVPYVASALALVVVVALLVLIVRAILGREAQSEEVDDDLTGESSVAPVPLDLTAPLREAAQALRSGAEPRDAVQAAWVALETRASAAHLARGASQTPTEFAARLTGATAADPAAVEALLRLYLSARFGDQPVGTRDVEAAQDALDRIAETWREDSADSADGSGRTPATGHEGATR